MINLTRWGWSALGRHWLRIVGFVLLATLIEHVDDIVRAVRL